MKSREEREWIQKIEGKEDRMLLSTIFDSYHRYQKTNIPVSSDFLNERELSVVMRALDYWKIPYSIVRAVDASERVIICFGDASFLSFYQIRNSHIQHRDVLGAMLGCGFSISMIGDIFVQNGVVYLTNLTKYDALLEHELTQIGKYSVELEKMDAFPEMIRTFQDISISASSTRFDLILSKLMRMSRSKTLEYMKTKRCLVNYQNISKVYFLEYGDILSIEGFGKYVVREIQKLKNGNFRIDLQKYS